MCPVLRYYILNTKVVGSVDGFPNLKFCLLNLTFCIYKLFELYFGNRLVINGKRLHSTTHTKKYM